MPTVIRAVRRVDGGNSKEEVVRIGSGITARRPIVSMEASGPQSPSSNGKIKVPAAHEVKFTLSKIKK